jgi:hypothetical protein
MQEATELTGVGYQTLRKAAGTQVDPGPLRVAKWTKRGNATSPLLVQREDLLQWAADRPTRGLIPMDEQYRRLLQLARSVLGESQAKKLASALSLDEYRRLHYGPRTK